MGQVRFGPFAFDPDAGALTRDGQPVALGGRASALLGAMLNGNGAVVGKADLMDAAWPGLTVEEGNLGVQIAALRKLLGKRPDGTDWIATVARVGYRLVLPPETKVERGDGRDARVPMIAVLPFQSLGDNTPQDHLADGVVEDITTALSRFTSLAVVARNSAFVYKGRAIDVREAARELGVRYVLEGSVRRAGDRLRITAQLVDGVSGAHLWAQNYDGTAEDIFEMQDRITESVVAVVSPKIVGAEVERSRRERAGSTAAYDLVLRAWDLAFTGRADENAEAIALLEQAIALEPDYAWPHQLAASALEYRIHMGWSQSAEADTKRCLEVAHAALALDLHDPGILATCGSILMIVGHEYDLGLRRILRALEINPNQTWVVYYAGNGHLRGGGSLSEAEELLRRAIRLSAGGNGPSMTSLAHVLICLDRFGEAVEWAERSLAVNPDPLGTRWVLIAALALAGRVDDAAKAAASLAALAPETSLDRVRRNQHCKDTGRVDVLIEGLRRAGLPER